MVQYFRLVGLALLLSVGMGSVGSAASFDCKQAYRDYVQALNKWLIPYFSNTDIAKLARNKTYENFTCTYPKRSHSDQFWFIIGSRTNWDRLTERAKG